MLADLVRKRHPGKEVVYVDDRMKLPEVLSEVVKPGDLFITMGAGDVTTAGPSSSSTWHPSRRREGLMGALQRRHGALGGSRYRCLRA